MKRTVGRVFGSVAASVLALVVSVQSAWADRPHPWQLGWQDPATPIAERLQALHSLVFYIIAAIVVLVFGLLGFVAIRFNARANPVPTRTAHNTVVEVLWTVMPIIVLAGIAFPSFRLLYYEERVPPSALTLKVTGIQWYWHYDYPDNGNFGFDSVIVDDKHLKDPSLRLLDVDNEVVLPVGENIRVQIAGNDVMHSWFITSLGVQKYAVPGRLNEVWMNITHPGTYYGECNQICGVNHTFMPIKVHAVSKPEFDAWVAQAKKKFAREDSSPPASQLASAQAATAVQ